ncbi:50S ribosomal protein L5 [bacterium BMS3Abin10]|nr:50S ribosomal protein L5 [bacterium BMS3Abin10]GBE38709.1 50S ribosomal protein L5 [bacterium BMS3Bbin08]HDH51085.1 50S ribosomal protein L5 [Nitrospirota bacterium]HDK41169.1 50S ribosomal protein L5 [Nitrospirota bacterium]
MARLRETYKKEVAPALMKEFGYKSIMQVPRLRSIVVNVGMGEAIQNIKLLDAAVKEIAVITGQRPVITRASKSIAGFKLRKDMPVGCKVTLRSEMMYDFLDKFISIALPRIRDFQGVSPKSFDGRGNYAFGVKEQVIFPEINHDKIVSVYGMDVIIVTSARTNEEGRALLRHLGMPFKK